MLEDKLLVRRFKCGRRDAFRAIYEKYASDLLTLAANLLGEGNAAEDVVQDVFISFVKSAERFHLRGSLRGYLAICVANRSRDYIRRKKRQPAYISRRVAGGGPASSPLPRPYQPGRLKRLCIQEKTQGMARTASISVSCGLRATGREPICRRAISSMGVTARQKLSKPGVSKTNPR